jgi:hypothetical protein
MRHLAAAFLIGTILGGCSTALPGEQLADAARVRITTDPALARGCDFVGAASATNETNLQRKAAWLGGNLAVVTLASQEARAATPWYQSVTTAAEVFRCEPTQ